MNNHTMTNTPLYSFNKKKLWARVLSVHDGDTMTCAIEAFPGCFFRYNIRFDGIDAYEMTSDKNKLLAIQGRNKLIYYLTEGKVALETSRQYTRNDIITELSKDVFLVFLHCKEMDKYGRILANVFKSDNSDCKSINQCLIDDGLAVTYHGGFKMRD